MATKRQKRVIKEIKRLKKDLPLHIGSTICLRVDRNRPFVMQVGRREEEIEERGREEEMEREEEDNRI